MKIVKVKTATKKVKTVADAKNEVAKVDSKAGDKIMAAIHELETARGHVGRSGDALLEVVRRFNDELPDNERRGIQRFAERVLSDFDGITKSASVAVNMIKN